MTVTASPSARPVPAPADAASESHDRQRPHLVVTAEPIGTSAFGVRLRWFVLAVPAFTVGWAFAQVMGAISWIAALLPERGNQP